VITRSAVVKRRDSPAGTTCIFRQRRPHRLECSANFQPELASKSLADESGDTMAIRTSDTSRRRAPIDPGEAPYRRGLSRAGNGPPSRGQPRPATSRLPDCSGRVARAFRARLNPCRDRCAVWDPRSSLSSNGRNDDGPQCSPPDRVHVPRPRIVTYNRLRRVVLVAASWAKRRCAGRQRRSPLFASSGSLTPIAPHLGIR
jgi:hypothetical protein